jgi:drug/metabolite transporter (DMT)-like permease
MSKIAKSYSAVNLQFFKTAYITLMCVGWFLIDAALEFESTGINFFSLDRAKALESLWPGWKNPVVWLLLTGNAIGPGVLADLLQQSGQKVTSASETNIILTTEMVFGVVGAFVLLGETLSLQEVAGGLLVLVAAFLASI